MRNDGEYVLHTVRQIDESSFDAVAQHEVQHLDDAYLLSPDITAFLREGQEMVVEGAYSGGRCRPASQRRA